jgi:hypothetical protein
LLGLVFGKALPRIECLRSKADAHINRRLRVEKKLTRRCL